MGSRYKRVKKKYPWITLTELWSSKGSGKWWKRRLSKARRKYIKSLLKTGRGKEPTGIESEVNGKGW